MKLAVAISRGGEGDDSSGVRILAAPSEVIPSRTPDRVRFSDLIGGGESSSRPRRGADDGIVNSLLNIGRAIDEEVKAWTAEDESAKGGKDCAGVAGTILGGASITARSFSRSAVISSRTMTSSPPVRLSVISSSLTAGRILSTPVAVWLTTGSLIGSSFIMVSNSGEDLVKDMDASSEMLSELGKDVGD